MLSLESFWRREKRQENGARRQKVDKKEVTGRTGTRRTQREGEEKGNSWCRNFIRWGCYLY